MCDSETIAVLCTSADHSYSKAPKELEAPASPIPEPSIDQTISLKEKSESETVEILCTDADYFYSKAPTELETPASPADDFSVVSDYDYNEDEWPQGTVISFIVKLSLVCCI